MANSPTEADDRKWTQRDTDAAFLEMLEERRVAFDQAMWQGPALTVAAQAFLLGVLTDETVHRTVRAVILAAGILACLAAAVALLRLRAREVMYSDALAHHCAQLGIPDPRPRHLELLPLDPRGAWEHVDGVVRRVANWRGWWPGYWLWLAALVAFVVADVVAYGMRGLRAGANRLLTHGVVPPGTKHHRYRLAVAVLPANPPLCSTAHHRPSWRRKNQLF